MQTQRKYQDKKWLHYAYSKKKLQISEIAKECGVSLTTISRWLSRFKMRDIRKYNVDRGGDRNPYWRGGKYKDNTSGYVWIYNPNHPFATKKGYVKEHRLVIERFLGRYLRRNEIIHHRNKIKDDNRIKNLEIIVLGEPNCGDVICPFCSKKFKTG